MFEETVLSAVALELCIMHSQHQHYTATGASTRLQTTEFDV